MRHINECSVRRIGSIVPLSSNALSPCILSDRNDLKLFTTVFLVDLLPTWQVKGTASPRCPGEQEHLLAAEVGKPHAVALPVGELEIGRHGVVEER